MTTATINYADGSVTERISVEAAIATLRTDYPDCVICDSWDDAGQNDDGEPMSRCLVWETQEDADNGPDGSTALAQIEVIGRLY